MTAPSDRFVSPATGWRGRLVAPLANAGRVRAIRRATMGRLPFVALASDVRDVVYASWLVPVARVAALVLSRIGLLERDGPTVLTALTYCHGPFGPCLLGPLRRLFPSPLQSNWRLHVAVAMAAWAAHRLSRSTRSPVAARPSRPPPVNPLSVVSYRAGPPLTTLGADTHP